MLAFRILNGHTKNRRFYLAAAPAQPGEMRRAHGPELAGTPLNRTIMTSGGADVFEENFDFTGGNSVVVL